MIQTETRVSLQPVIYTPVHKGIRNRLFKIAVDAGKMDNSNEESFNQFYNDFALLTAYIHFHHDSEHNHIHPVLESRAPGGAEQLEEDHQVIDHMMVNLTTHLDNLKNQSADFEKRREMGLEFYLSYNEFLAFFLEHLYEEEDHIQRALWDLCTKDELVKMMGKMMGNSPPPMLKESLEMIFSSANIDEITALTMQAKPGMPAPAFQNALNLAERHMNAKDWTTLKLRLGIK